MIKPRIQASFCAFLSFLMVSCNTAEPSATVNVATEKSPAFTLSSALATETPVKASPDVTPTFVSIYTNPEPITDGKLKLSITTRNQACHRLSDPIRLVVRYENLTNASLTLVNYNVVARVPLFGGPAQLFPVITTTHNEQISVPEDLMSLDSGNPDAPSSRELPAKNMFEFFVEYYFPPQITDMNGQGPAQPMPPGQYLLKFVYLSIGKEDSWKGTVSSSQVAICIVD
jgi:hypothetical protein